MKTIHTSARLTITHLPEAILPSQTAAPPESILPSQAAALPEIILPPETVTLLQTTDALENMLFFDIETTGFSPDLAQVYLIGCLYYETSSASWKIIQWFCEQPEDEPLLLGLFIDFLKPYQTIIHYNGDAFDLAFIRSRCKFWGLDFSLSQIQSLDLYKKIRPWKTALSLPSLKQKAVEEFLSICREAPYTGRQLIAAYQNYLSAKKNALFHMLLLHNQEDLRGLMQIFSLMVYPKLSERIFSLTQKGLAEYKGNLCLQLLYQSSLSFPVPFCLEGSFFTICGQERQILCYLPVYEGELKYFYPDVQNYYYLPCEDMAVHKSVGSYVAKNARKKATPKTCYTRKTGLFFPQPEAFFQPAFQLSFQSSPSYAEYHQERFSQVQDADRFLHELFRLLPVFP